MRDLILMLSLVVTLAFTACQSDSVADSRLEIVATTGQIHDALRAITDGAPVDLRVLCGPGVDPHSYQASTQDVQAMAAADLVVFNGFHLEARLADLLGDQGRLVARSWSMASAFPVERRLDWTEQGVIDPAAPFDPHIWNDLPGWAACVRALAARIGDLDPERAARYRDQGAAHAAEIERAHLWAGDVLKQLPENRRYLVSGHDAFHYFGRAYGLETVAVLGIGNESEADIGSIRSVAELICARRVPVIFLESITNPKLATALQEACRARDWSVEIAQQRLYSDDLGPQPPQNTYLGAFRSNVTVIHDALQI